MLFENSNNYFDYIDILNVTGNQNNIKSKFLRGNMFDNEYIPYKDYRIKEYHPNNEKDKKMFEIMMYSFALNDMAIYLDVNPSDMDIYKKYQEYANDLKNLESSFEKEYGPLTNCASNYPKYKWIESPWPWDKENVKYV